MVMLIQDTTSLPAAGATEMRNRYQRLKDVYRVHEVGMQNKLAWYVLWEFTDEEIEREFQIVKGDAS